MKTEIPDGPLLIRSDELVDMMLARASVTPDAVTRQMLTVGAKHIDELATGVTNRNIRLVSVQAENRTLETLILSAATPFGTLMMISPLLTEGWRFLTIILLFTITMACAIAIPPIAARRAVARYKKHREWPEPKPEPEVLAKRGTT